MDETIKGQPRHRITCRFAAIFLLATSVVAWFRSRRGAAAKKVPRIGMCQRQSQRAWFSIKIFRQALQELGYFEGKNIRLSIATPREIGTASRELSPNS